MKNALVKKRRAYYIALYKAAHASSTSGVSQSLRKTYFESGVV